MKKLVLCILDGWGVTEQKAHNAIESANIPFYHSLLAQYPHSLLQASGQFVGLPDGQIGNSEVGHLTIGAGRRIFQDLPRVDHAISSGELFQKPSVKGLLSIAGTQSKCHLIGILSDGGVHGHISHMLAIAKFLRDNGVDVLIHGITDGRDVAPQSALKFVDECEQAGFKLTSLSGRFYAMDRDKREARTLAAVETMVNGVGAKYASVRDYIASSYADGINDEFIVPASFDEYTGFEAGDCVFFSNYRADRMRQIARAVCIPELGLALKVSLRPYASDIKCSAVFPYEAINNTLGQVIADAGLAQLRMAETEKYAHVTYFFNGGNEQPNLNEDRILIPSPQVETYDIMPEMSSYQITHQLVDAIESGGYDMILVNYANADMVGHTGDIKATIKAAESIDLCLQGLVETCKRNRYELLITADHGNAECMYDEKSGQPLTAHTLNPVPFIYIGGRKIKLQDGELADVAPTVLELMDLPKPHDMTGSSRIIG